MSVSFVPEYAAVMIIVRQGGAANPELSRRMPVIAMRVMKKDFTPGTR